MFVQDLNCCVIYGVDDYPDGIRIYKPAKLVELHLKHAMALVKDDFKVAAIVFLRAIFGITLREAHRIVQEIRRQQLEAHAGRRHD